MRHDVAGEVWGEKGKSKRRRQRKRGSTVCSKTSTHWPCHEFAIQWSSLIHPENYIEIHSQLRVILLTDTPGMFGLETWSQSPGPFAVVSVSVFVLSSLVSSFSLMFGLSLKLSKLKPRPDHWRRPRTPLFRTL